MVDGSGGGQAGGQAGNVCCCSSGGLSFPGHVCTVPDYKLLEPPTPLPDAGSFSPPSRLLSCPPLLGVAGQGPEWFG